ncbi:GNAT family N-acetyltransferase [Leucothrix arctica]|uniref:N-acetyltransferase n=1 Tax=Leucothrix arctica TaxID=1481894 RepID=A0A317CGQ5_9GAMM|nr:GNAT family N-acetyltransferase [Leucothrix arctica]PWQ97764.1 N-acetyltransferase [Leucothrix arctica]
MKFIQPLESHLLEMMSWFSSEKELTDWSGPNFRYPYDKSSFIEDLKISTLSSFSLVSNESSFLAFGQYYQRLDRCHLGRLIVNPEFRGKGIAFELMRRICESGLKELKVKECSLFVLAHNENAIKAYNKYGFTVVSYPDEISLENCLYMVKR